MSRSGKALHLSIYLLLLLAGAGCGPLVAQGLRSTEGVRSSAVLPGSGAPPKAGSRAAILSPFAKTKDSFYICRGEDEEALAEAFRSAGTFETATVHGKKADEAASLAASLKGKSPAEAKAELSTPFEPDVIVTGTILTRRTMVSPFRGVIMDVSYRISFLDLRTGTTWSVDVAVRTLAEGAVHAVAEEIARLAAPRR
jgi:hypothetical protein